MTDDFLDQLQADVFGILSNTPSLALACKVADDKGDLEGEIENHLATVNDESGKCGLAIIVLAVEVEKADENLPGPPLQVRVDVQTLEMVELNRHAGNGTLIHSANAATRVLAALHLFQLGPCSLYAGKNPIRPLPVRQGFVGHIVSLRTRLNGAAVVARPLAVQVSLAAGSGDGIAVTGTLTADGSTPLVFPATIPSAGTANGRPTYYIVTGAGEFGAIWKTVANPFTGSGDFTGWFLQEDGDGVAWASTADVATPDLVPAGAWHASTNPLAWRPVSPATGTPLVAASGASTITFTCASPSSSIRYTTDGSYPSPAKTLYTGPFALPDAGTVIRAAAYVAGMPPSDILEFTVTE